MQKDLIYHYGKYFEDDKIVLDNYSLEEGLYVKIGKNGKILNKLYIDKDSYENLKGNEDYEWFKDRDFYSPMLNMNKCISTECKEEKNYSTDKKLMSNNYLTLFFKNDVIKELFNVGNEEAGEKKTTSENKKEKIIPLNIFKIVIEQYYNSVVNLGKKKDEKKVVEMLTIPEVPNDKIIECKNIYLENIQEIVQCLKNEKLKKNTRIKLFIDENLESYKISSLKYYALKIFNASCYNQFLDNELYGANNYNFSMNSNKPYLVLKTTPFKVSSRITLKDIKIIRNMYIWFMKNMNLYKGEQLSVQFKFDSDFRKEELKEIFILKCVKNKGDLVIANFEYVPNYTKEIKEICFRNYINKLELKNFEQQISKLNELEQVINLNWFNKFLYTGYFNYTSISSVKVESCYKEFILQYSKLFYEFFYKLNDKPLKQNIDKIGINITKKLLLNELTSKEFIKYKSLYNSTKSINLYLILKEYLNGRGGENVDNIIDNLKENMRKVLYTKAHIETEDEFCFLIGQVAYYLISHSKAEKLNQDVFDPIINSNNIKAVKKELEYLYKKYKHEIGLNNIRFKKAFSEILAYEPKEKLKNNETILLIGFLTDNLFYEKKGESEDE